MFSYNLSTTYILPLLLDYVDLKYDDYLASTFLKNELYDNNIGEFLYIVYNYNNSVGSNDGFPLYENELLDNKYVENIYDINDRKNTVVSFKIPDELADEVTKVITGAYSTLTKYSKNKILKYWVERYGAKNVLKLNQILTKSNELRLEMEVEYEGHIPEDAELGNLYKLDDETLKFII